jgi:hypothetical protein
MEIEYHFKVAPPPHVRDKVEPLQRIGPPCLPWDMASERLLRWALLH